MTFLPSFALLLAICLSAAAGVAPVLMNPFTTNTTAAADAHVVALVSGPTNGVSSAVVTNIVNGMVQSNQFTKLASGTALDGLVFTNLNATNIIGKISTNNLPMSLLETNGSGAAAVKAATNAIPAGVWTLGSASQSNSGAFYHTSNPASYIDAAAAAVISKGLIVASNLATVAQATALATAVTNSYPWMVNAQPIETSNTFSFFTNFTIPVTSTNWTIVIPGAATNYIVMYNLYLQAKIANPSGITMPLGSIKDCGEVVGYTQPVQPFNIFAHVDGRTFVLATDGDYANFVDEASQPVLLNPTAVAAGFNLRVKFTWTISK